SNIIKLSEKFEYLNMNHSTIEAQAQVEGDFIFDFEKEYYAISGDILFESSCLLSALLPPLNNENTGVIKH
ncbi:MAG: hypothetical protein RSO15_01035, partial [Bacteroides sp.]|uniref:hypothetical protein n=1 Tax=Bacteroides sp. TaxID=29523 RepID=UPI002FCB4E88